MRPSRIVVATGNSQIFISDYFNPSLSVWVVPTGGATWTVNWTGDDPNDTSFTTTWVVVTPGGTGTTTTLVAVSNTPVRALQFVTTVAGSAAYTVIQGSGGDGLGLDYGV